MSLWLACLLISPSAMSQAVTDWPAIVQQPYESLPRAAIGFKPLSQAADGRQIVSREEWARKRDELSRAWLDRLGRAPDKPDKLDVTVEATETRPDCALRLVSFASEGHDRIRAYLLIPKDLKAGERRPAVVVFHQTTPETFRESVGLAGKPELAFALHLVRRGYVTLSPECYIMKDKESRDHSAAELARRRPGWTGLGKMTFDASRSIDYLETVPEVDKSRIGCIGHSLGAKEVLYAMAFEPRYRA